LGTGLKKIHVHSDLSLGYSFSELIKSKSLLGARASLQGLWRKDSGTQDLKPFRKRRIWGSYCLILGSMACEGSLIGSHEACQLQHPLLLQCQYCTLEILPFLPLGVGRLGNSFNFLHSVPHLSLPDII
jgi:hypothetical protein